MKTTTAEPQEKAAHTQGPWTIRTEPPLSRFILSGQYNFGHFEGWAEDGVTTEEEDAANAQLIASAPDLLAALAELVRLRDATFAATDRQWAEGIVAARRAIAKAEGVQNDGICETCGSTILLGRMRHHRTWCMAEGAQ